MQASHNRSLSEICQFSHGICNDGMILFQINLALETTLICYGSECAYHLPLFLTNQFFSVQYDNDKPCTIAWFCKFTQRQRQQDPTSQDALGVSMKSLSRSTCADKNSKDSPSLCLSCDSAHAACAYDKKKKKVFTEILLPVLRELSSRSLTCR